MKTPTWDEFHPGITFTNTTGRRVQLCPPDGHVVEVKPGDTMVLSEEWGTTLMWIERPDQPTTLLATTWAEYR